MKAFLIISIIFVTTCISVHSQISDTVKYQSLEPKAFHEKYLEENDHLLIDVREFFEFRKSRIKGAINVPSKGGYSVAADTISKEKALFVYCFSGGRSKKAAQLFSDHGFPKVYNLKGGITLWKKERLPVERKRVRR